MRPRQFLIGLVLVALTGLTGCGDDRPSPHLVVTQVTHFLVQGNGTALNFPVFAETMDVERIERDLNTAEYYHRKLSALYDFKSFTLLRSQTYESMVSHEGTWHSAHPIYDHKYDHSRVLLSFVGFEDARASYAFAVVNQEDGQIKDHVVEVPSGQSASIGMLFDPEANRGHLLVISMLSTSLGESTQPEEFKEFLRRKNRLGDSIGGVDYTPGDQKWMDELFGAGTHPLPIAPPEPDVAGIEKVAFDQPPTPVGGMTALHEAIVYPEAARRDGISGRVLLRVHVDTEGHVTETEIVRGVREDLDQAASAAVKSVRFYPALLEDQPVACWIMIPLVFALR